MWHNSLMDTSAPILVIDIEATCWKHPVPPPGQQAEIIEIGICPLDPVSLQPGEARSILVKPQRSRVSDFCTQLTTLTQVQVDAGIGFDAACALLMAEYASGERMWASWGDYDLHKFKAQCESFGVSYPFGQRHLNIKKRFAALELRGKQMGMARALQHAALPLEGRHHRGGDDARNIARLLAYLLAKHGMAVTETHDKTT